eukprot:evm.model.scf_41.3 EVM.evm.TU.scf_41.3   scf_41:159306-165833(+)
MLPHVTTLTPGRVATKGCAPAAPSRPRGLAESPGTARASLRPLRLHVASLSSEVTRRASDAEEIATSPNSPTHRTMGDAGAVEAEDLPSRSAFEAIEARRAGERASTAGASWDEAEGVEGGRVVEGVMIPEKYVDLPAKEALRRARIGARNARKVPWNKGRKASADLLAKIKAGTLEAMQRPEVKQKLSERRRGPHTEEAKLRISSSMKAHHAKLRKQKGDLLAVKQSAQLKRESEKEDGLAIHKPAGRQLTKSPGAPPQRSKRRKAMDVEQRQKISEAIRRKWGEPTYRDKMIRGIQAGQEKRLETIMASAPARERAKSMKRLAEDELELERQRKFKEVTEVVSRLENEINSLEAQRFIHVAEKDADTVVEIDEVLEEARGVLNQVKGLMKPLSRKFGSSGPNTNASNSNGDASASKMRTDGNTV